MNAIRSQAASKRKPETPVKEPDRSKEPPVREPEPPPQEQEARSAATKTR
jgi:hypothetical protein